MTKWIDGIATALTSFMYLCGGALMVSLNPELLDTPPTVYMALMWCLGGILIALYIVGAKLAKRPTE